MNKNGNTADLLNGRHSNTLLFLRAKLGHDNFGDTVINGILIEKMREHGQVVLPSQEKNDPRYDAVKIAETETTDHYGLNFNNLLLKAAFKSLRSGKKLNVYLFESPGHRFGNSTLWESKDSIKAVAHYFLFKLLGVKIITVGTSIGPFSKPMELAEKYRSRMMYDYTLRDSISVEYAKSFGLSQVRVFPDLAWFLRIKPNKFGIEFETNEEDLAKIRNEIRSVEQDYVLLSFRSTVYKLANASDYLDSLLRHLDKILEEVIGNGIEKVILTYQVAQDREVCQTILARYKGVFEVVLIDHLMRAEAMHEIYSRASLVLTNRLHVYMFALACGALPVVLTDKKMHYKISGILNDAGLQDFLIDTKTETDVSVRKMKEITSSNEAKERSLKIFSDKRIKAEKEFFMLMQD